MFTILGIVLLLIVIVAIMIVVGLQKGKIADNLSAEETEDLIDLTRRLKDE